MSTETPLWTPDPQRAEHAQITHFTRQVEAKYNVNLADYSALHRWSVENREDFWQTLVEFTNVNFHQPPTQILSNGDKMPGAKWFQGATLNFAENLLRYAHQDSYKQKTALVFVGENGDRETITYGGLLKQVAAVAANLKAQGVMQGDRIAGFMPNRIETIIAMLATTSLGAVWSSCSPDFGVNGVLDRFGQISPKVLFCCDGYFYNGNRIDSLERVNMMLEKIPSIEQLVIVAYAGSDTVRPDKAVTWESYLAHSAEVPEYVSTDFNHPVYILYSSGTTGIPKCIVHGVGGTLLQHLKEHILHTNVGPEETLFFFTTCGWMMWNWLVSGLATGATIILYDGSPFYPEADRLMDLIDAENITMFGTSAKYLASMEKEGLSPKQTHELTHLTTIMSTGSPLAYEGFHYVYDNFRPDICLSSISGGTDLISCFALGNPALPVYAGQIQCPGLGMDVAFYDEHGQAVLGEKGELVCQQAFPSMPVGFWDDPNDEKYRRAYFEIWQDTWAHGDYGELTEQGGVIIHGRSDAVLNPGGVRIGTSEIYRQVEKVPAVRESLAIGQQWQSDVRVVLFVVMQPGENLDDALRDDIRQTIRQNATPRHVPAKILEVEDIPRTISGKIVELAVRNVVHGDPVKNTDALANPEALAFFKDRQELLD
ncbi:MAG: acetoacetate--CoA ligase [Pseudomonadota bacterium]